MDRASTDVYLSQYGCTKKKKHPQTLDLFCSERFPVPQWVKLIKIASQRSKKWWVTWLKIVVSSWWRWEWSARWNGTHEARLQYHSRLRLRKTSKKMSVARSVVLSYEETKIHSNKHNMIWLGAYKKYIYLVTFSLFFIVDMIISLCLLRKWKFLFGRISICLEWNTLVFIYYYEKYDISNLITVIKCQIGSIITHSGKQSVMKEYICDYMGFYSFNNSCVVVIVCYQ